tara:strand:- start:109 stop:936 length:828 start_codon:yes stop_codon:yes gene_type:complete
LIGLSTSNINTTLSYLISQFIIITFLNFNENISSETMYNFLILNIVLIGFLSFVITTSLKTQRGGKYINIGDILSIYLILITFFLSLFLLFFYFQIDFDPVIQKIKELFLKDIQTQDEDLYSRLINILEFSLKIFPAINSVIFFLITILNLNLSIKILNKLNIKVNTEINYSNFVMPKYCLYLIFTFFLLVLFSSENYQILSINLLITFATIYVVSGYLIIVKKVDKYNINIFIKILLFFLLFIFFSYLLIIFLFLSGMIDQIKQIHYQKKMSGE